MTASSLSLEDTLRLALLAVKSGGNRKNRNRICSNSPTEVLGAFVFLLLLLRDASENNQNSQFSSAAGDQKAQEPETLNASPGKPKP